MDTKRVILNNKSRKGYYFRVVYNGVYRYYKYKKGFTKEGAAQKFLDSAYKSKSEKVKDKFDFLKEDVKEIPEEEMEGVTVHFRVDYARGQYHHTEMKFTETYVQLTPDIIKGMSNEEIIEEAKGRLGEFWAYKVGWSGASAVTDGVEREEIITGLSNGGGNIIQVRTKYGTYRGTYEDSVKGLEKKMREDFEYLSQFGKGKK